MQPKSSNLGFEMFDMRPKRRHSFSGRSPRKKLSVSPRGLSPHLSVSPRGISPRGRSPRGKSPRHSPRDYQPVQFTAYSQGSESRFDSFHMSRTGDASSSFVSKVNRQQEIEDIEKKHTGAYFFERILGKKLYGILLVFLGLTKIKSIEDKFRRLFCLCFIILLIIHSSILIPFNIIGLINNSKEKWWYIELINNSICEIIYVLLFLLLFFIPKFQNFCLGIIILISIEQLTVIHFQEVTGIMTKSEIALICVSSHATLFLYKKTSTRIIWALFIFFYVLAILISEIIMNDYLFLNYQQRISSLTKNQFIGEVIWTYFYVFIPSFIFSGVYLIFQTYDKAQKKIIIQQKLKIDKVEVLKDDLDVLIEEKLAENTEDVAYLRVDKSLFVVPIEELELKTIVGQGGGEATVYLANWKGKEIAFKVFKTLNMGDKQRNFENFEKEVSIMCSIAHPYIIQFLGACIKPPKVGILMEYCKNKNIRLFLYSKWKKKKKKYKMSKKFRWLLQISDAMDYLHSRNIIHRDLKCENVLINDRYDTKLMDFGLSKVLKPEDMEEEQTKRLGTSAYMAPEMYNSGYYDNMVDVYSFSMMIFMIISENFDPYNKRKDETKKDLVIELNVSQDANFRPKIVKSQFSFCNWVIDLMKRCWNHDPNLRPNFSEIKRIIQENTIEENENNNKGKMHFKTRKIFKSGKALNLMDDKTADIAKSESNSTIIEYIVNPLQEDEDETSSSKSPYEIKFSKYD